MGRATLRELIDEASQVLESVGHSSAQQDAEQLAARVLRVEVDGLPLGRELDDRSARKLRDLVTRRADGVPLGHLTGFALFAGLELAVGPGVFVPRVHSELVLAAGLRAVVDVSAPNVVDLCAGSGAIALAVAHRRPDARVHAVEFDPIAADFARRNSTRRAALGDTLVAVHESDVARTSLLTELEAQVDLVLANPPFMPEQADVPAEFGRYQPQQAIFGGADGLRVVRQALDAAARLLRPDGSLVVEHGHLHGETVPGLLRADGCFEDVSCHPDHDGWPLYTVAVRTASP